MCHRQLADDRCWGAARLPDGGEVRRQGCCGRSVGGWARGLHETETDMLVD